MDASEVISMVAETAHNLAALASDETVTHEAPDRCMKAAHDLETSVALILTAQWIPPDAPTLTASLQAVNKNLKSVQTRSTARFTTSWITGGPREFSAWAPRIAVHGCLSISAKY